MELRRFRYLLVCLLMTFAAAAQGAAEAKRAPHQLVEQVTESLLQDISTYRESLKETGDKKKREALLDQFYQEIMATLKPVVDFNWVALNVMGPYRKEASSEQKEKFQEVFARGLVETYGRGLLTYSNEKIVTHPLQEEVGDKRRVTVRQEIRGKDQSYPLLYSMGLNRQGEWKVLHVIINGINLGETFRNQFVQAAKTYDGDIDRVIANWTTRQVYETENN